MLESALADRARQAVYLQALQPLAETTGDQNPYGFRPKRRGADAIDQGFKVLRQKTSATWIVAGDSQGFVDNIRFVWLEAHIPMHQGVLSNWLHSGFLDHGPLFATPAGVPQGGIISPVISNLVLDGLETVVHGGSRHRRVHHITYVRWADDVRPITRHQIPFPERRGSEEKTPGSTAHLKAKARGNHSMPLKRRRSEDVYDLAVQDPRDTVRATRPKPQSPAMAAYLP